MAMSHPDTSGFALVLGTQLYYEVVGAGLPLVLIHGGWLDGRMWDDQLSTFAAHATVLRYDVRGYGRSAMPNIPYSHVADLDAFLTTLEMPTLAVLGLSMGGMIALDFALEHPSRVRAVIAVATPVRGLPPSPKEFELAAAPVRAAQQGNRAEAVSLQFGRWFPDNRTAASRQTRERIRAIMEDFSFPRLSPTAPAEQWPAPVTAERLADVKAPTLVIVGEEDDTYIRRCADVLAAQIPTAQLISLPGTGHLVNIEAPEQFHQAVLTFLKQLAVDPQLES
jgi:pimeloyl-ACP methyl ester carboxylesterase